MAQYLIQKREWVERKLRAFGGYVDCYTTWKTIRKSDAPLYNLPDCGTFEQMRVTYKGKVVLK